MWKTICRFDRYELFGEPSEIGIEEGKAGDQASAIRRVTTAERTIRQILLAHSDLERSYTYSFCGQPPMAVHNYVATIRVTPVTETNRAFVEWWATFDCAVDQQDRWTKYFERRGFAKWLDNLRRFMHDRQKSTGTPGVEVDASLCAAFCIA